MAAHVLNPASSEEAVVFGVEGRLVGIVTPPPAHAATGAPRIGVIFLNAGVVHRVGPSRLYVTLARHLSRAGFTAFRFDHSGIGDSQPRNDHLTFEQSSVAEAIEAMDWLAAERGCRHFVIVGLCSGTLTAFRTAQADDRVKSVVLLTALLVDPSTVPAEVVQEASERRIARSYLVEKASSAAAWRKIFARRVDYRRIVRVLRRLIAGRVKPPTAVPGSDVLVRELQALLERGVSLQFIYAEPTTVLEWFRMTVAPAIPGLQRHGRIEVHIIKHADHTFTRLRHQSEVVQRVATWVRQCI
jgi:pimeloyl-ACP methyl ester carboxylesterase